MIRSSQLSLKFANRKRLADLSLFIDEYCKVTGLFVDLLWDKPKIASLVPKEITSQVSTWLSARAVQCAGKQASGIVRGTQAKQKKRKAVQSRLMKQGKLKQAKRLQGIINRVQTTKPDIKSVNPELDSRFVKFDSKNATSFDIWLTLGSLGNRMQIKFPLKQTKHFNALKGEMLAGVRISKTSATFMFESESAAVTVGEVVGLDIGVATVASLSDGQTTNADSHEHTLATIQQKLTRKEKGSKAFQKARSHRSNFVNWSINQLNFAGVKELRVEDIKDLRRGNRTSRYLNHWTYTEIKAKLAMTCESLGVQVTCVDPTYTSQRCSRCGWVRKSNRKGKTFKCGQCGYAVDADLNAAGNIALVLPAISKKERLTQANRIGFYWFAEGQERIVPATPNEA